MQRQLVIPIQDVSIQGFDNLVLYLQKLHALTPRLSLVRRKKHSKEKAYYRFSDTVIDGYFKEELSPLSKEEMQEILKNSLMAPPPESGSTDHSYSIEYIRQKLIHLHFIKQGSGGWRADATKYLKLYGKTGEFALKLSMQQHNNMKDFLTHSTNLIHPEIVKLFSEADLNSGQLKLSRTFSGLDYSIIKADEPIVLFKGKHFAASNKSTHVVKHAQGLKGERYMVRIAKGVSGELLLHSTIPTLLALGHFKACITIRNKTYLVTKYMPGQTLSQVMENENLSLTEKLYISVRLLQIIGKLNRENLSHRDIQLNNILYCAKTQTVSLIDVLSTLITTGQKMVQPVSNNYSLTQTVVEKSEKRASEFIDPAVLRLASQPTPLQLSLQNKTNESSTKSVDLHAVDVNGDFYSMTRVIGLLLGFCKKGNQTVWQEIFDDTNNKLSLIHNQYRKLLNGPVKERLKVSEAMIVELCNLDENEEKSTSVIRKRFNIIREKLDRLASITILFPDESKFSSESSGVISKLVPLIEEGAIIDGCYYSISVIARCGTEDGFDSLRDCGAIAAPSEKIYKLDYEGRLIERELGIPYTLKLSESGRLYLKQNDCNLEEELDNILIRSQCQDNKEDADNKSASRKKDEKPLFFIRKRFGIIKEKLDILGSMTTLFPDESKFSSESTGVISKLVPLIEEGTITDGCYYSISVITRNNNEDTNGSVFNYCAIAAPSEKIYKLDYEGRLTVKEWGTSYTLELSESGRLSLKVSDCNFERELDNILRKLKSANTIENASNNQKSSNGFS